MPKQRAISTAVSEKGADRKPAISITGRPGAGSALSKQAQLSVGNSDRPERSRKTNSQEFERVEADRRTSHNEGMNLSNINQATEWFQVLQTTDRSQAAVMRLEPGKATGKHAESHEDSEQCLLLIQGELAAEIGSERFTMNTGDMVIIPAGVKHKFTNHGTAVAVTFNTYCPPEYPPDEKE